MKALVMLKYCGPEVVALREVPAPTPQANEVVVEVAAAGLNPVDRKIRLGGVPRPDVLPAAGGDGQRAGGAGAGGRLGGERVSQDSMERPARSLNAG